MVKKLLITSKDIIPSTPGFEVAGVFNPGCAVYNGETVLLLRISERPVNDDPSVVLAPMLDGDGNITVRSFSRNNKDCNFSDSRIITEGGRRYLTTLSHLRLARSCDGVNFKIDDRATIMPQGKYEQFGIEDARITCLQGIYYITFSCVSPLGIVTGLITTKDFISFERRGNIFHPDNKDVVIFPEMIDGQFYALHRPSISEFGKRSIWLARSQDAVCWGDHRCVAGPAESGFDCERVGGSCVPFLTPHGWAVIYHGADFSSRYAAGLMLLDRSDPSKVLRRGALPLFEADTDFELNGFFGGVVFPCGCIERGDTVDVYYGAADDRVAMVTFTRSEIYAHLGLEPPPPQEQIEFKTCIHAFKRG